MTETLTSPDTSRSPQMLLAELSAPGPEPHPLTTTELELLLDNGMPSAEEEGPTPTASPGAKGASAGVAVTGQKVTALYAEQTNRNAWAHFATAGWKKLSPLTDTGSTTMALLAAHARATGSAPNADENPAGTIAAMYVW